jgi:hypothetical protein
MADESESIKEYRGQTPIPKKTVVKKAIVSAELTRGQTPIPKRKAPPEKEG